MEAQHRGRLLESSTAIMPRGEELPDSSGLFRGMTLIAESADTVKATRDFTLRTLYDWGIHVTRAEDARLVVSELVTNAIKHAIPDQGLLRPGGARRVDLLLKKWPRWLFVGVGDEDSSAPELPLGELISPELAGQFSEAILPERARGLLVIHRLADAVWWSPDERGGKTVWTRFDLDGGSAHSPP